MVDWSVKVLYYGHATLKKSVIMPYLDEDVVFDIPYLGFLLQKDERNILVDTGISEKTGIVDGKAWGGLPAVGGRSYLEKALADAKVKPEDIETVIYTHLHNDHAANCDLFTNANFITQKSEWETLLDPLPVMKVRKDYDPGLVAELSQVDLLKVDGDFELTDGIKIIKTPGHTPGSQSVCVRTKKGAVVIVGDQFHISCMAFPKQNELIDMYGKSHKITPAPDVYGPFYPSTLVYNYYDWYDSGYKIRAMAEKNEPEFILCGHEPSLLSTSNKEAENG